MSSDRNTFRGHTLTWNRKTGEVTWLNGYEPAQFEQAIPAGEILDFPEPISDGIRHWHSRNRRPQPQKRR